MRHVVEPARPGVGGHRRRRASRPTRRPTPGRALARGSRRRRAVGAAWRRDRRLGAARAVRRRIADLDTADLVVVAGDREVADARRRGRAARPQGPPARREARHRRAPAARPGPRRDATAWRAPGSTRLATPSTEPGLAALARRRGAPVLLVTDPVDLGRRSRRSPSGGGLRRKPGGVLPLPQLAQRARRPPGRASAPTRARCWRAAEAGERAALICRRRRSGRRLAGRRALADGDRGADAWWPARRSRTRSPGGRTSCCRPRSTGARGPLTTSRAARSACARPCSRRAASARRAGSSAVGPRTSASSSRPPAPGPSPRMVARAPGVRRLTWAALGERAPPAPAARLQAAAGRRPPAARRAAGRARGPALRAWWPPPADDARRRPSSARRTSPTSARRWVVLNHADAARLGLADGDVGGRRDADGRAPRARPHVAPPRRRAPCASTAAGLRCRHRHRRRAERRADGRRAVHHRRQGAGADEPADGASSRS